MKWNVKPAPERLPERGMIICLLDADSLFFENLAPDDMALARKFQKDLSAGKPVEPIVTAVSGSGGGCFLYFSGPDLLKGMSKNEAIKAIAFQAWKRARALGVKHLFFLLDSQNARDLAPLLAEGVMIGSYRFDKYLGGNRKDSGPGISFLCHASFRARAKQEISEREQVCLSLNNAREIINEPGNRMTPGDLADHARHLARKLRLSVRVLTEKGLDKEGYNGLLTVGSGSPHPPRLITLSYDPGKKAGKKHLCLLGKGITFDTGGICLKQPRKMWEMKSDMAGAASALHTVEAVARLRLPIKVTAIVPAAENAIGSGVTLPGNIFRAKNGKTVHVDNTDAEGRLVLTDAFGLAEKLKPSHLVDLATLTGACVYALGPSISGLFGDDSEFNKTFLELAGEAGEPCWELPLFDEYRSLLKCDFADLNNIGSMREGGAIHAALFLSEFKSGDAPWIHLDIAGTAFTMKEWKYFQPGATGVGIRSLVLLAKQLSGK